ncbi:MAG: M18 family aminopeptidase [bacterium]
MKITNDFLKFMENSVTCFHAVEEIKNRLLKEGYKEITNTEVFDVKLNSKYFITKNLSSIIAFTTPTTTENFHFQMTASHTDSPSYKLKPNHEVKSLNYYKTLNVEPYGGNIHQSWFDKPLSLAGRVIVKGKNSIKQQLVNIDKDLMVIPSVAIHLNENSNKMTYNPQIDLQPLYGTEDSLDILDIIKKENKIEEIVDFDLFVYNRFRGSVVGYNNEFLNCPQIDDLQMTYGTLVGLLNSKNNKSSCNVFVAFDNEEVGSNTKQGADSTFLKDTLVNIRKSLGLKCNTHSAIINSSFMISADNAHAAHPNHPEKTDNKNACYLNKGVTIKYNANQRYTTDGFSASVFKTICEKANVAHQSIANRSDVRGGSTLGNISVSQVSCNSVDIGLPQFAMHSSAELSGTKDLTDLVKLTEVYFNTNITIKETEITFE